MIDPDHPLAELLRRDRRYHRDAYFFVFEALRFAQEQLGIGGITQVAEQFELIGGWSQGLGTRLIAKPQSGQGEYEASY